MFLRGSDIRRPAGVDPSYISFSTAANPELHCFKNLERKTCAMLQFFSPGHENRSYFFKLPQAKKTFQVPYGLLRRAPSRGLVDAALLKPGDGVLVSSVPD